VCALRCGGSASAKLRELRTTPRTLPLKTGSGRPGGSTRLARHVERCRRKHDWRPTARGPWGGSRIRPNSAYQTADECSESSGENLVEAFVVRPNVHDHGREKEEHNGHRYHRRHAQAAATSMPRGYRSCRRLRNSSRRTCAVLAFGCKASAASQNEAPLDRPGVARRVRGPRRDGSLVRERSSHAARGLRDRRKERCPVRLAELGVGPLVNSVFVLGVRAQVLDQRASRLEAHDVRSIPAPSSARRARIRL